MGIAWTPPIVPKGDDENVYLVVDDLGSYGEVWREIETVRTDLEAVVTALLDGQYVIPFGSLASTPLRAGRGMSPKMWRMNCSTAVTGKVTTFRPIWQVS